MLISIARTAEKKIQSPKRIKQDKPSQRAIVSKFKIQTEIPRADLKSTESISLSKIVYKK